MQIAGSCLCCASARFPEIEDALHQLAALGFSAFDLDCLQGWQHLSPAALVGCVDRWSERLLSAMEETGMRCVSFNCGLSVRPADPRPEAREQYLTETVALLDLAANVGCPNLTLQPGGIIPDVERPLQKATLKQRLSEVVELLDGRPITVGLEGHAHTLLERPDEALDIVAGASPQGGCTFDPSHQAMSDIPLETAEPLLDHTVHVHLRNATSGNMQAAMETEGIDFGRAIELLRAHGYGGAVTIEYFNDFDPDFTSVCALRDRLMELGLSVD